jgi:transcriptional regulator with XRE-family HTH domain
MPNRVSTLREAARAGDWLRRDIGRELRVARILSGLTQAEVARLIGKSASYVSRVEHGRIGGVQMTDFSRLAAAVGLKPWLRLFPAGRRIMDAPQLQLLARFRERLGPGWQIRLEVPMPLPGDLRAADALISVTGCRCIVEIITRLADFQAQVRAARRKQRDLSAERLILVVLGSTTNRRALQEIGAAVPTELPLGTREALEKLAVDADPGGDCLVML